MENTKEKISEIHQFCMGLPGAYESRPFGRYPICYRIMGKIFAQLNPQPDFYKITLKCSPEQAQLYRKLYPGMVVRGYHCPPVQQPYWNTVALDHFTDEPSLLQMIQEAYEETIKKLPAKSRRQLPKLSRFRFIKTDGEHPDFVMLCGRLDQRLDEIVGGHTARKAYVSYNLRDSIHDVLLIYDGTLPVGCGSFKAYDEAHAELKRIYVEPAYNGLGLGTELIRRLEALAKIQGFKWCLLETGAILEAACHVYEKLGYKVIPNYGPYADMVQSICMQRKI